MAGGKGQCAKKAPDQGQLGGVNHRIWGTGRNNTSIITVPTGAFGVLAHRRCRKWEKVCRLPADWRLELTRLPNPRYNDSMEATGHIEISSDTCSGHPRVSGTRIRVANVVLWSEQGESPEEIVVAYPQLTLADVHSALAFYFDNRPEMNELIRGDEQFVAGVKAEHGRHQSIGTDADADSLSS